MGGAGWSRLLAGLALLGYGLLCTVVGLLQLAGCPRHPLLSLWLLTWGLAALLASLPVLVLPACRSRPESAGRPATPDRPAVLLLFLTMLLSILLLLAAISWLSVGTFWLVGAGPGGPGAALPCHRILLVLASLTACLAWAATAAAALTAVWLAVRGRSSPAGYTAVRQRSGPGAEGGDTETGRIGGRTVL